MNITRSAAPHSDCPFLGLKSDPETALAYPTTANHCFHCKTPSIPILEHQAAYCLSQNYEECRVYQQAERGSFPSQLRQNVKTSRAAPKIWRFVLTVMILAAAGFVIWLGYQAFLVRQAAAAQVAQAARLTSSVSSTLTLTPTAEAPTPTATGAPASKTPEPTATSLPPQKHALEVPVNVDGQDFVIHVVIGGEQLVLLARDYKTSIEAILALNYQIPETVWAGSAVVIAPGLQAAGPLKLSFSAYKVTDKEITVEDLATKLAVDPALLKRYTRCEQGCLLNSGDWVIVPHPAP